MHLHQGIEHVLRPGSNLCNRWYRRSGQAAAVHNYASDPSTGVHFFCYAIDDGEVQTWRPEEPPPEPFANPSAYFFIADNWEFERTIHAHILVPRYGFPSIPLENQDCAQRLALASSFPADLGLRCEATLYITIMVLALAAAIGKFYLRWRQHRPETARAVQPYRPILQN